MRKCGTKPRREHRRASEPSAALTGKPKQREPLDHNRANRDAANSNHTDRSIVARFSWLMAFPVHRCRRRTDMEAVLNGNKMLRSYIIIWSDTTGRTTRGVRSDEQLRSHSVSSLVDPGTSARSGQEHTRRRESHEKGQSGKGPVQDTNAFDGGEQPHALVDWKTRAGHECCPYR